MALENLVVTPPPHLRSKEQTAVAMRDVLIALAPVTVAALVAFTYNALFNIALAVGSCMFFEWAVRKARKKKVNLADGSAAVTGLLLALLFPARIQWLNLIIASFVAIVVVKELMGGLGRNLFNPALFGFVFALTCSGLLASWTGSLGFLKAGYDGVQSATPLVYIKQGLESSGPSYLALLFANFGGAISEVGAFWVLLGGAYLLYRKVIDWVIPVTILATVFVLAYIVGSDGVYNILAGGVMLGAFFMATDWVTSPMNTWGQVVYGLIIGVCVVIIRVFLAPAGAVAYSILIGNAFVPLLDTVFKPKRFGEVAAA
ncbi:MAG: RnfABCDGE type electron transport complex subunit D [Actinobacteria bacterium]|nr:RnfABCDGE type electron transport complex subunit D [Actinomycetota bacterium]MDI6831429.1 RnfABCDGE type electron transport complex subunit D [Actinomycetota bacterium]